MDELARLREDFKDHAANDERNFLEIRVRLESIDKKLDPIIDAYKAVILSRSFIVGFAGLVGAVAVIGAGIIWLVNNSIHK